jgi:hypothetical protein
MESLNFEPMEVFEQEMVPEIHKLRTILEVISYKGLDHAIGPKYIRLVLEEFCAVLEEVIEKFDQYHYQLISLNEAYKSELEDNSI